MNLSKTFLGTKILVIAVALSPLGCGSGTEDERTASALCGSGAAKAISLSPGDEVTLDDGRTKLAFRKVHQHVTFPALRPTAEGGLPYISLGDEWLEIIQRLTIATNGFVFGVQRISCSETLKNHGDYSTSDLSSCKFSVISCKAEATPVKPASFTWNASLASRDAALVSEPQGDALVAVRSLGFYIGNVDMETSVVQSVELGLDFMTSFGVHNIDVAYGDAEPIIGREWSYSSGPYSMHARILDIGNSNTHCNPQEGCRDVLDVELKGEATGAALAPQILEYH